MTTERRSAFVTGTSRGLGRGLAAEFLSRGWGVVGSSRGPADLEGARGYRHLRLDQARPEELEDALAALPAGAPFDLVVLNAGVLGSIGELRALPLAEARRVMDVNLWANKALIDGLSARGRLGAQLVAMSSGASVNGHRGWGAYALSKAALNMLVQLYARELPGTHCVSLAPGLVDTGMQAELRSRAPDARYPSLERLRAARGTADMPGPEEVAPRLVDALLSLPERCASGAFADLRALEGGAP